MLDKTIKIAICSDIPEFQANHIQDKNWLAKFPGAQWMHELYALAKNHDIEVVTGDLAVTHVRGRYWNADKVWVIQELRAVHGMELTSLGARPFVLTGMESPLYAYDFYDRLHAIAPQYPYRVLFGGAFDSYDALDGENIQLCFPNFSQSNIQPLVPWSERDFLVLVASNKYWKERFNFPSFHDPIRYIGWLRRTWWRLISRSRKHAIRVQLHDKRLEAIEYFGSRNQLSLFGPGWSDFDRLPTEWKRRLEEILQTLNAHGCENKAATMSRYRFALCFENISYPGYITEKIIDCFVAGVIPVYFGAPDIQTQIPENAFIDFRTFSSLEKLDHYLKNLTETTAMEMIEAGRAFLASEQGKRYTHEGFAEFVWDLVERDSLSESKS